MSPPKYPLQQVTNGLVQCCEEGKVSCMLVRCPGNELNLLPEAEEKEKDFLRSSHHQIFDRLQYVKTEGGGLVHFTITLLST